MGHDKAMLNRDGKSLLERTVSLALEVTHRVVVVGRPMPTVWGFPQIPFLPDSAIKCGPIGGLIASLRFAKDASVVLLPTDMPLLTSETVNWIVGLSGLIVEGIDGVCLIRAERMEPLGSIYAQSCNTNAENLQHSEIRSLKHLITICNFVTVVVPEQYQSALTNVNTKEDFDRVVAIQG